MVSYFKYQQATKDEAIADDDTIRDGHCIRVSMQDAQKARAERQQLSDAEQRVADYLEWQRHGYYSRPVCDEAPLSVLKILSRLYEPPTKE